MPWAIHLYRDKTTEVCCSKWEASWYVDTKIKINFVISKYMVMFVYGKYGYD